MWIVDLYWHWMSLNVDVWIHDARNTVYLGNTSMLWQLFVELACTLLCICDVEVWYWTVNRLSCVSAAACFYSWGCLQTSTTTTTVSFYWAGLCQHLLQCQLDFQCRIWELLKVTRVDKYVTQVGYKWDQCYCRSRISCRLIVVFVVVFCWIPVIVLYAVICGFKWESMIHSLWMLMEWYSFVIYFLFQVTCLRHSHVMLYRHMMSQC